MNVGPPAHAGDAGLNLLRDATTALHLARSERPLAALAAFRRAIASADACVAAGDSQAAELRARLRCGLAAACCEAGHYDDALDAAQWAVADAAAESAEGWTWRSYLRDLSAIELATAQTRLKACEAAADLLRPLVASRAAAPAPTLVDARALRLLGTTEAQLNRPDLSRTYLVKALAAFGHPAHVEFGRERAAVLNNLGFTDWERGRIEAALDAMLQARAIYEGLWAAGNPPAAIDLGRVAMNIGGVYTSMSRFDDAKRSYADALRYYGVALHHTPEPAIRQRIRASRAMTLMNDGFVDFRAGQLTAAESTLRAACRAFAHLGPWRHRVQDDEARTQVNLAHVLAARGDPEAAARLYARAWGTLQGLMDDAGRTDLSFFSANARLGLGRSLAQQGRLTEAAPHFEGAAAALVERTRAGQLHMARPWSLGLWDHLHSALPAVKDDRSADLLGASVRRVLQQLPRFGTVDLDVQLRDIEHGLQRLAELRPLAGGPAQTEGIMADCLGLLLDRISLLLAEAPPGELRRHADRMASTVSALAAAARSFPGQPHLHADWFLCTHGLRAQRSAIAAGHASGELRALLERLQRLEETLLAGAAIADAALTPARGPAAWAEVAAAPLPDAAHSRAWRTLSARYGRRRDALVSAARLPPMMRLDARELASTMAPHEALLMLARPAPDALLAVALHAPDSRGQSVTVHAVELPMAATDCAAALRALRAGTGPATRADGLRRAAAGVPMPTPARAAAEQGARLVYAKIVDRLLQPVMRRVAERSITDIAIVPSADLHLLPFHELLEPVLAPGTSLCVYPHAGAWASQRRQPARPRLPCWALVADEAEGDAAALPWVAVERELTLQLWGPARVKLLRADALRAEGVGALLGMGHSGTDPVSASGGLVVGPDKVLSGHDLAEIRVCHGVLLAACVLGQVDEVVGEPMGFLSACFGYHTGFGSGWLVDVPDAEACLFSLALQHGLRADESSDTPWVDTFRRVRRTVQEGRWPDGFADWLVQHLPAVAERLPRGRWTSRYEYLRDFDGGMYASPPPSLRRIVPWVVALGR